MSCVHGERHVHRALDVVGLLDGIVEEHHEAVAREALERARELRDALAHRGVVLGERRHHLFGLEALGEGGEAAQVGEEDGDQLALRAQLAAPPRAITCSMICGGKKRSELGELELARAQPLGRLDPDQRLHGLLRDRLQHLELEPLPGVAALARAERRGRRSRGRRAAIGRSASAPSRSKHA